MKSDYESEDNLQIALRCLPALAVVPSTDVAEAFWILADYMPELEKMPELLAYFEHTYIRGRRRPERNECHRSALYPIENGIILRVHRKELLELQTQSKVDITDCKHYFSVVTQRYGLLFRDWTKICKCNTQH